MKPVTQQIAELIQIAADLEDLTDYACAQRVAAAIVATLAGTDTEPGVLDRYQLREIPKPDGTGPMLAWYREGDATEGAFVGLVADGSLSQAGLTLGEVVLGALHHEEQR